MPHLSLSNGLSIGQVNPIIYARALKRGEVCNQAPFVWFVVFGDYTKGAGLD